MSMMSEFKSFAMKGNVMDMAIGRVDFGGLYYALDGSSYESLSVAEEAGAALVKYGAFLQNVVDFLIIAFVIFMMVRWINKLKKKEEEKPAAPPEPSDEVKLLTEIRDSLAKG